MVPQWAVERLRRFGNCYRNPMRVYPSKLVDSTRRRDAKPYIRHMHPAQYYGPMHSLEIWQWQLSQPGKHRGNSDYCSLQGTALHQAVTKPYKTVPFHTD